MQTETKKYTATPVFVSSTLRRKGRENDWKNRKGFTMDSPRAQNRIDRRTFLSSTAAATAAIAFSPMVSAKSAGAKPDDLNVALLGAGAQGNELMTACLKIPGIRFKAVCDIWQAHSLKRVVNTLGKYRHDATGYTDYGSVGQYWLSIADPNDAPTSITLSHDTVVEYATHPSGRIRSPCQTPSFRYSKPKRAQSRGVALA